MKNIFIVLFVSAIGLLSLSFYQKTTGFKQSIKNEVGLVVPPSSLKYFHFGYSESIADSLWIRLIQDFEYCRPSTHMTVEPSDQNKKRASIEERVNLQGKNFIDELMSDPVENICEKGWSYQMLDLITELSPGFQLAHRLGATNLSVLARDRVGATLIFDKAIERFPKDWTLLYRAAYHALYEEKNLETAATRLRQAAEAGGPVWLYSLASRLYEKTGQAILGHSVLSQFVKEAKDYPHWQEKAKGRLERLKKQLKK